ncbi:M1 family aminopeptidase [Spirosoma sp.]|uniref:M1 family aminopeptidase n=1 Tax=Spirosoma sp. TaxID=1899569 RepID=UPI002610CC5F|nr:M1 family aminopeptidase [Spirosoma sp.]MCX6217237.1 M1 family aminopeptidase [Spirosoma sp.]
MTSRKLLLVALLLTGFSGYAQTPHITGDVYISIKNGTFKADLDVSRLPKTTNYAIRLNAGLNIQFFRDSTNTFSYASGREYKPDKSDESFQYWFPEKDQKGRYLPGRFKVSYVGAFPVSGDSAKRSEWGDWKGNIAFNGKTLRASEQTAWYPILYDIAEDKDYQNVTFDITIHAPDAKAIYLNGCPPQYGQQARFRSDRPFPLLLFVGDFDFRKEQNTYLLNTTLTAPQATVLDGWFSRIKGYYAQKLQIPYGADITLLASTPVSKRNDWLFVSYPTIASVSPKGWLNTLVDPKKLVLADSSLLSFIAHELGHYYFGSVVTPNSTLRWVFLEGMTEYISLQATRDLIGQVFYDRQLKRYIGATKSMTDFTPLRKINATGDIDEVYRYQYIPLLLTALEQQIGRQQMWKWLQTILNTPNAATDYGLFKSSLLKSGVSEKVVSDFEETYLSTDNSRAALLALFKPTSTTYYYWGLSKEVLKAGNSRKPQAFYTAIKQMKLDDEEIKKASQQYSAYVQSHCNPANEMCTSDFNYYESMEDAQRAQTRWLNNLSDKYAVKKADF